jgi:hypothetical protein
MQTGMVQARNDYVLGSTLYQGFWRGDQGWRRTVELISEVPQWGSAVWSQNLITLNDADFASTGSGSMKAQDNFAIP